MGATVLPSQGVHCGWTTVKDLCTWASVDDVMWGQFARHLQDASLQNSLLAAFHPRSLEEAVEAVGTGAIGRTKLRLLYALAGTMFDLEPPTTPGTEDC